MTDSQVQTPAQKAIGDFAPKLVSLTDDVLFGDIWERPELSKRDRSLVTVAALVTNGSTEQLRSHLVRAKDNGLTEAELKEAIIHLAFYAGPGRCPLSQWRRRSSAPDAIVARGNPDHGTMAANIRRGPSRDAPRGFGTKYDTRQPS